MKRLILVFLSLIFFARCSSDRVPDGVTPRDEMIPLLVDIHLIDGYTMSLPYDSINKTAPQLYRSAFKKHNTDSTQFNKSIQYYSLNPKVLDEMYKDVKLRLEALNKVEIKRAELEAKRLERIRLKNEKRIKDSLIKAQKRLSDSLKKVQPKAVQTGKRKG